MRLVIESDTYCVCISLRVKITGLRVAVSFLMLSRDAMLQREAACASESHHRRIFAQTLLYTHNLVGQIICRENAVATCPGASGIDLKT